MNHYEEGVNHHEEGVDHYQEGVNHLPEEQQRREDAPEPLLRLGGDAHVDERRLGRAHLLAVLPAGRRQAARPARGGGGGEPLLGGVNHY